MPARPCLFVACAPSGSRIHPPYVKLFRKHCPAESTRIVERPKNQGPELLHRATTVYCVGRVSRALKIGWKPKPASARTRSSRMSGGTLAKQVRSEEHTSELQSLRHLVCRLL